VQIRSSSITASLIGVTGKEGEVNGGHERTNLPPRLFEAREAHPPPVAADRPVTTGDAIDFRKSKRVDGSHHPLKKVLADHDCIRVPDRGGRRSREYLAYYKRNVRESVAETETRRRGRIIMEDDHQKSWGMHSTIGGGCWERTDRLLIPRIRFPGT
jgi:hypothetical protein